MQNEGEKRVFIEGMNLDGGERNKDSGPKRCRVQRQFTWGSFPY